MGRVTSWLRVRAVADRVLAAVAAALTAPLVAVVAVLVRRDGGPWLITVPRVGRGGRTFGMYKIRSMKVASADGQAGGVGLTSAGDSRITPIGHKIRALHLDELPQLLNVVKGEMTLLGPRPEAPGYVDLDDEGWQRVLAVAPGIAGPTQLIVGDWEREVISRESGEADYVSQVVPVKLAIDEWYVGAASGRLDLLVVTTLVRHILGGAEGTELQARVEASVPLAASPIAWERSRRD
jgi:lipopolysaccharide/colanic/teichoic acid biosynthesis glycosyltransferase